MKRRETIPLTKHRMLRRRDQGPVQGKAGGSCRGFALPGGYAERGEPLTEAVFREARWMDLAQLKDGGLTPGMDSTLSLFWDETIGECLFSCENGQ